MKALVADWARFLAGLVVSATGTVATVRAHVGLSPWDVLNDGLSRQTPLTFGQAILTVSVVLVAASWLFGMRPSVATVVNTVVIGWCVDRLLGTGIGAGLVSASLESRVLVLIFGVVTIGIGAAIYIGAGLGAGPRDSLQLALSLRTGIGAGWSRAVIEGSALAIGWCLGGSVGLGTLVSVTIIGFAVGGAFMLLRVDSGGRRLGADGPDLGGGMGRT
jgi:uncharacterized membrane protein YczE